MRSETRRKLDLSYSQHVPRAFAFAWLVTGNEPLSARLAVRAWRKSMGSMQDLRGPDVLEAKMLRSIVSGASRANLLHRRRSKFELGGVWLRLPSRTRAALVMLYFDEIDPRHVADMLECSDATLASLRSRGLKQLEPHLGEAGEDHLRNWLTERAETAPPSPRESARLQRRVRRRRLVTVGGTALLALLLAAGAVAATRVALDRAENPPAQTLREEDEPLSPELRNRLDELSERCPDPNRLLSLPGAGARAEGAAVAVQFNRAVLRGDAGLIRALAEPSAAQPRTGDLASTSTVKGVAVTSARRVSAEDLYAVACGRVTARRSLRVVMHDRSGTTSEGLAFFYVAQTVDGWRVWAADEPGA